MLGMVENCVYKQVDRPKDKLVVGTKMVPSPPDFMPRQGREVQVSTCRSRVLAGGRCTLHGKVLATPASASIRMLLTMAAAKDGELRYVDAEQAFLKADIDEEIHIEIPEEFQEVLGAVGRLNKAIYGLVPAGRCWNNKFCDDMTVIGFEQAKADPCVFRKVVDGEAEMVVVLILKVALAAKKRLRTINCAES